MSADMFTMPSAAAPPAAPPVPVPLLEGQALSEWVRETLWTASADRPRSRQAAIGPSELGLACSREIAYKLAGTAPVNFGIDPMPSMVGTAMHAHMAEIFSAARPVGRYLVEHRVTYRGVSGTLDLYDRRTATLLDWKFPKRAKVRRVLADGPPRQYRWQMQVYAAGLVAAGETPARIAVVYIPVDGALTDIATWMFPIVPAEADEAVDRQDTVRAQLLEAGAPGQVTANPSRLCPWCPYHRPQWSGDLAVACPGETS